MLIALTVTEEVIVQIFFIKKKKKKINKKKYYLTPFGQIILFSVPFTKKFTKK